MTKLNVWGNLQLVGSGQYLYELCFLGLGGFGFQNKSTNLGLLSKEQSFPSMERGEEGGGELGEIRQICPILESCGLRSDLPDTVLFISMLSVHLQVCRV